MGKRLSIKVLSGDVGTRRSHPPPTHTLAPVRFLITNSQQPFLSGAGDSPINTDIPPQRAVHAKRAPPYPSGSSAGVYLQLGGYEDRHAEKCHLSSLLAVLAPFVLWSWSCWRCLRSPPSLSLYHHHYTQSSSSSSSSFSSSSSSPSPTAQRRGGDDDPGVQDPRPRRLSLSLSLSLPSQGESITRTLASPPHGAGEEVVRG